MGSLRILIQLVVSLAFLAFNFVVLFFILGQNQKAGQERGAETAPEDLVEGTDELNPADILEWEFEYARTTASESMEQRHTMVNFYLLAAGVVISGVVALLSSEVRLPFFVGTVLLWLLCCIGWIYFLSIIRLRQAWHDSARTMNEIKYFYIRYAKGFAPEALEAAFRWKKATLPAADKPWSVFYYSAMLIALLDSVAYVAGGALLGLKAPPYFFVPSLVLLGVFGLALFCFHVWLYHAFLKPRPSGAAHPADADRDETEDS
jgi:hypothetical protein